MGGALLNLIASTNSEAQFLTGNPNTSFFYTTFNQYCNFGMQKFRLNYEKEKEHIISTVGLKNGRFWTNCLRKKSA